MAVKKAATKKPAAKPSAVKAAKAAKDIKKPAAKPAKKPAPKAASLAQIRALLAKPSIGCLGTVTEKGAPWVRYVVAMGDEKRVRFASFLSSRKVAHIRKNPKVHLTLGIDSMETMGAYLQIDGTAKIVTAKKELLAYWNPHLTRYYSGPDDPEYCLIDVTPKLIEHNGTDMKVTVWKK